MNLLVITTLLISIIAIYAQVIALQTARMFSHQSGVAQEMLAWHTAAVSMAANIIATNAAGYNPVAAAGCSLTWNKPPGFAGARCPAPILRSGWTDPAGTVTDSTGKLNWVFNSATNFNDCVHLPNWCSSVVAGTGCSSCVPFYDTGNYQFYSLLFRYNNQDYVATIIPAGATTQTYITLPGGNQIALTTTDLMQQLGHTTVTSASYGFVNAAYQLNTSLVQVTLPNFSNANGAVAVISSGF